MYIYADYFQKKKKKIQEKLRQIGKKLNICCF